MRISRRLLATTLLCLGSAPTIAAPLPVCPMQPGRVMTYDLLRGGSVIGQQTVRFEPAGPDMTVRIDVSAAVRALGMAMYKYEHHGVETWHDGQMVALATRTDDDGTPRHVDAARDPATGWRGVSGPPPGMAPLLATSMWNSQTAAATRLLDRETGAVVPVTVHPAGTETLTLGNRQVAAQRFDLVGPVSGSVWYGGDGCWVRALFHTRVDGSLVEVRAR